MIGHCPCSATGLSSHAIARAFRHCWNGGTDHPHDPADLKRCVDYCKSHGISDEALRFQMQSVSPEWDALTAAWRGLVTSLDEEFPTGRAPKTYAQMKELFRMVTQ